MNTQYDIPHTVNYHLKYRKFALFRFVHSAIYSPHRFHNLSSRSKLYIREATKLIGEHVSFPSRIMPATHFRQKADTFSNILLPTLPKSGPRICHARSPSQHQENQLFNHTFILILRAQSEHHDLHSCEARSGQRSIVPLVPLKQPCLGAVL